MSLQIKTSLEFLKHLVQEFEDDEYVMLDEFDDLDNYLFETLTIEHEPILLSYWDAGELHPNWKRELLSYFAKIRSVNPKILKALRAFWDEDPQASSKFLDDHPHPILFDACGEWIEGSAPWFKYIGSRTKYNAIDHMDWVEATGAWARYSFPEESKNFEDRLESANDKNFRKILDEEINWREKKIEKYFLEGFPEHVEEWLFITELDPEFRKEFMTMLKAVQLKESRPTAKNKPCACGSGKLTKRCCG